MAFSQQHYQQQAVVGSRTIPPIERPLSSIVVRFWLREFPKQFVRAFSKSLCKSIHLKNLNFDPFESQTKKALLRLFGFRPAVSDLQPLFGAPAGRFG